MNLNTDQSEEAKEFRRQRAQKGAAAFHQKWDGTPEQHSWTALGYWTCGEKYGFETVNKIAFGQNLTKGQYKAQNGGAR